MLSYESDYLIKITQLDAVTMLGNHVCYGEYNSYNYECLFIRSKILSTVPNIEPNIPKMTKLQFLIKIHLGHGSSLTAKSNNAGVMSDKVDIQIIGNIHGKVYFMGVTNIK